MEDSGRSAIYRLAVAGFINGTGSAMGHVALPIAIYRETDSVVWLSASFFFTFGVAGLLEPFAGAIADRFDRRRVAIACSLLSAVGWGVLPLGDGPIWLIGMGFVAGIIGMPAGAALGAAVPNLVGPDDLDWANGTFAIARRGSQISGFALGGLIAASLGAPTAFLINAASFVADAAIIATVHRSFQAQGADTDRERRGSAFVGFPIIWRDPILRSLFIVWTILFFTLDIAVVADLPISDEFGWGDAGYGWINVAFGIGGVVGAFFGRKITRWFEPWAVLIGVLGASFGYLLVAAAPLFAFVLLGNAIVAATDAGDETAGFSIIQRSTADAVRGRVISAVFTAGLTANAIGFTFAGFLVEAFGPRAVFLIGGLGSLAAGPLLLPMFRGLRAREHQAGVSSTETFDQSPSPS